MCIYYRLRTGSYLRVDIKQIRKIKLRRLIEDAKGRANLARKLGIGHAYISQILSDTTKAGMGDAFARKCEVVLKKPHGWMDSLDERESAMLSKASVDHTMKYIGLDPEDQKIIDSMIESLLAKKPPKKSRH